MPELNQVLKFQAPSAVLPTGYPPPIFSYNARLHMESQLLYNPNHLSMKAAFSTLNPVLTKFSPYNKIEKPKVKHQCKICGKCFATPNYLETHKRLHTGEKPYECKICGRKFAQRPGYTYHMRSAHTCEKKYKCK